MTAEETCFQELFILSFSVFSLSKGKTILFVLHSSVISDRKKSLRRKVRIRFGFYSALKNRTLLNLNNNYFATL